MSAKKKTVTATVKIFKTESVAVTKTVALTAKVTVNYSDINGDNESDSDSKSKRDGDSDHNDEKENNIYQCECHDFCSFGLENTSVKIAKGTLHLILHLKLKNNAFIACVIPNFVDTLNTLFPQFTRITLKYKIQTHTL